MEIDDQAKVVRSLIEIEAKFLTASLDRYASLIRYIEVSYAYQRSRSGAIFYAKDMPSCTPAEIRGEILQTVKEDVQRRFVVGTTVER
jgi:hypothetical protein